MDQKHFDQNGHYKTLDYEKAYEYYSRLAIEKKFNVITFELFRESLSQYIYLQELIFGDRDFINKINELINKSS